MTRNEELAYHRAARDFHAAKVRELEETKRPAGKGRSTDSTPAASSQPPAMTARDIGERLSLTRTSVYRLFTRKDHPIPHIKTGDTGVRVQVDTFEKWLREEEQMSVGSSSRRRS